MRRAVAAFVATVAGLVVLLSFKTAGTKSVDRPVALSGTSAGTSDNGTPPSASANPGPAASPSPSATASPSASPTPRATTAAPTKTVTGGSFTVSEGFRTFG